MYITVDKNVTYQTFEGFGASGAWWAQAVGGWTNTDPASGMAVRDRISQLLFSREQGIGLRTYRYNIGGGSVSGKGDFPNPLRRTEMFETSPGRYDFARDAGAVYMMRRAGSTRPPSPCRQNRSARFCFQARRKAEVPLV